MIRRAFAIIVLIWLLGFIGFAVSLPGPAGPTYTDAVAVLTGADGRIEEGIAVLARREAGRMLVSGVSPEVRASEFAAKYRLSAAAMRCCITLGTRAYDTVSNADEVAGWVQAGGVHSLRLVTSASHMPRARWELRRALPAGVTLVEDGVPGHPSLRTLFLEYNKLVARRLSTLVWR